MAEKRLASQLIAVGVINKMVPDNVVDDDRCRLKPLELPPPMLSRRGKLTVLSRDDGFTPPCTGCHEMHAARA